jgi:hypothetical protein
MKVPDGVKAQLMVILASPRGLVYHSAFRVCIQAHCIDEGSLRVGKLTASIVWMRVVSFTCSEMRRAISWHTPASSTEIQGGNEQ